MITRRQLNKIALGLATLPLVRFARAEAWPSRPIRLIVSYAPGGVTDTVTRAVAQQLTELLGQPVVVENKPGAAGVIGTEMVANAPPDGYTLLIYVDGNSMMPASIKVLHHDAVRSFSPISILGRGSLVIVAHPSFPASTLPELIRYAKANPGAIYYATPGLSSPQQLAFESIKRLAGFEAVHVPYKGGAQAVVDVVGGQVKLGVLGMAPALPHIGAGKLKALAITGRERSASLPDVPTVAEAALPGFEMLQWQGLVAPAGTPPEIVAQIHAAVVRAMRTPDVIVKLRAIGMDNSSSASPEEFRQFIIRETARWPDLFRAAGIQPE